MPAPLSLETIIRKECVPVLDCMLTVTDDTGEAAFLYFKEGELVEANFASLWGRDALAEIVNWTICSRAIAPLPLGIKRSLWEPLEELLQRGGLSRSGSLGTASLAPRKLAASTPGALDRYKRIPNLLKMVEISRERESVLYEGVEKATPAETEWLVEFAGRVRAVGDTLGFGFCDRWMIETEKTQIVAFARDDGYVALLRRKVPMQDDLEAALAAVMED